jgi:apolipoprotein N-acyltransferase
VKPSARRWRTLVSGAVSGLLFALAFPPFSWTVLLPLALVPWLAALAWEESRARALLSGAVFGLVYWSVSIRWITYVVTQYGGQSEAMGVVSLAILAAILAEWPAVVAWGVVAVAPPGAAARLAVFPLLWAASEHARSFVYGGFPWNLTAHALFRQPVWLQSASVWGAYGTGAAVAAVSALIARAVTARRLRPLAAAALLVLALGLFGAVRLARPPEAGGQLEVALLQPNLSEEMRSTAEGRAEAYRSVLAQALAAAQEHPALIVIPESTLPFYWQASERLRQDLTSIARRGPEILFNDLEEEDDGRYYNVARLLSQNGLAGPPYRKVHLVPFGEYVPLPRIFFFVRRISTAIGEFTPAPEPSLLRSGAIALGVGICYEIIYPSLARREVAEGANLLATISNDSWYGRAGAQEQHFAGATLRSVENGRYLLRAAITGISGIVDARGRIVAESRPNEKTTVTGVARLQGEMTPWNRGGFWIPRLADLAALGVLLFGLARRRQSHSRPMTHDPRPSR